MLLFRLLALAAVILSAFYSKSQEPQDFFKENRGSFHLHANPSSLLIGDILFDQIKKAQNSIDIQIYALTDKELLTLLNKKARSCQITIYYDPSASKNLEMKLDPKIKSTAYQGKGLMHRKICLIDDDLSLIGSSNYTTSSLFWHFNNLVSIRSKALQDFIKSQTKGRCKFELGEVFLLPDVKNQALDTIVGKIQNAKDSIHLAMFSLTHPKILTELENASARNVKLYLYLDKVNLSSSSEPLKKTLSKAWKVFSQKNQVLLHHKFCLIDGEVFITGSSNWSKSGFKKNEEVLLIFDKLTAPEKQSCLDLVETLQKELKEEVFNNQAA